MLFRFLNVCQFVDIKQQCLSDFPCHTMRFHNRLRAINNNRELLISKSFDLIFIVTTHPVDFKQNLKYFQRNLCGMKKHTAGVQNIFCLNPRSKAIESPSQSAQPNQSDLGRIGQAAQLAISMAFNLGFQTNYILKP